MADEQNPSTFNVSDDFEMFEAKAETALHDVRKAERRTMGFPLEVGTKGRCIILSIEATKSKVKDDGKGNITGGNPMIVMVHQVVTPEEKKGAKVYRNFVLNESPGMTAAQRYAMWLDYMEGCGLPREVRENGKTKDVVGWAAAEPREFDYEIIQDQYAGNAEKRNIRPVFNNTQPLPGATSTSAAMQAAATDWKPHMPGTFAGKEIEFLDYASEDKKKATVVFVDTKKSMIIDIEDLKPKK